MDSITEQLGQLQELTDEQLAELENSAITEFDGVSKQDLTPQNVDSMEQLANAVEAVRAEKSRRSAEMEQLSQKAAEAAARVNPPDLEDPSAVDDGQQDQADGDGTGMPDEAPEDTPADAPPASPGDPAVEPNPGEGDDSKLKKPVYSNESDKAAELSDASTEEAPPATTASADAPETTPPAAADEAAAESETPEAAPPAAAEASTETPDAAEAAAKDDEDEDKPDDKSDEATAESDTASTDAPAEAEANTETEAPAEASENTPDNTNPEAPVTAAAQGNGGSAQAQPPADRKPVLKPAAATMTITAGADIPGITAGTTFNDMKGVAEAFTKRLHSLRHVNGGDGEQHIVASLQFEYPEDRTLEANDASSNTDKIFEVTGPEALTAAAGICLPLETRYDLGCEVGVTDRPVRDALARFAADRGGIRYFSSPLLTDEANATGFWRGTGTNGAPPFHTYGPDRTTATSPADAKPCLEVQCTQENTAYIEAITLCLTFNNLTTRTFPELIARHNELALVAHARIAENALLAQLEAGSTAITAQGQVVGATREIMNLLGRAVAAYRFKHRMNSVAPLRMVAPMWVMDLMRADLALQMPGDGMSDTLGVAESQINTWFRSRGVNITWHLDGVGPAVGDLDDAGTGTANGFEWPTTLEFGLWAEGTWLYLDGGTLDLGVIRDSGLVATNQYKQFVETFEGVANMGCDSYWVTAAYVPTGQAASLVDTLP